MTTDIDHLHHVGFVVHDLPAALEVMDRLGFQLPPPAYPMLPDDDGVPRAFGAANTHAYLTGSFVELVTTIAPGTSPPAGARLIPVAVPPEALPQVRSLIQTTVDRLADRVARFDGLHRLVFRCEDVEQVAKRLADAGVPHTGVVTTQRPVETDDGPRVETIRHLEVFGDGGDPPEAVVAVGEAESLHGHAGTVHANGATDLVEVVLSAAPGDVDELVARYATYLDVPAQRGPHGTKLDLGTAAVRIVTPDELALLLPGEVPPALPAMVAYAVTVTDLTAAEALVGAAGCTIGRTAEGGPFVPAAEALGAALVFRQA